MQVDISTVNRCTNVRWIRRNGLKLSGTVQNRKQNPSVTKAKNYSIPIGGNSIHLFLSLHDFRDIKGNKFGVDFVLICRNIAYKNSS